MRALFKAWIMAHLWEIKLFSSTVFGVSCLETLTTQDAQLAVPTGSLLLQATRNSLLSLAIDFLPAYKDAPEKMWTAFKIDCQHSGGTWRTFYHDNTFDSEANAVGFSPFHKLHIASVDMLHFWFLLISREQCWVFLLKWLMEKEVQ